MSVTFRPALLLLGAALCDAWSHGQSLVVTVGQTTTDVLPVLAVLCLGYSFSVTLGGGR